jgi:quinohemoprotein ethanol dehydrogenase
MTCKETMAMLTLSPGRSVPLLLASLALLAAACSKPADPAAAAPATAPKVAAAKVDGAAIEALAQGGGEWLNYGRGYSEQRFSPLTQINADSVKDLGLSWSIDLDNTRGLQATPLFHDGVLYTTLSWSRVMAVDARTGKQLWFYDPEVKKIIGEKACCGVNNRGVALWKGKVFFGTLDGRLIALDASTGKPVWSQQTTDNSRPYTITGAPRVVKGKVLIGNGGAEMGVRGYLSAYDVDTGEMAWRFYTVPGDPSKPFENPELEAAAKTWNGDKYWEYGGGGTAWDAMAYDPELDLLYVGTGNGSPWNREVRSPGGGDNLYLSSILALKPDTGRLVWHYQVTPGDTWDFTATQHLMLAELPMGDATRKVIMQAPKNGFFYVLDRETGELLSAEAFGKVTWASGVDLKTGRPIEVEGARYEEKPSVQWPGPLGAHNWQPMSYSPQTGLVYLPYQELPGIYRNEGEAFVFRARGFNTASGLEDIVDLPAEMGSGALLAWDPVAQKEVWRAPRPVYWNGGTLATAGNLVFQGTATGQFEAYTADKGEKRWSFDAQTGVIAAPMTYELDGEQYVALMAGWGGAGALLGGGAAAAANTTNISRLLVFKLGGTASLPPKPAPVAMTAPPAPEVDEATLALGQKHYQANCALCHGVGAVGSGLLPDLRGLPPGMNPAFMAIVRDGVLEPLGMPCFAELLSEDDVKALKAFIDHRAALTLATAAK